MTNILYVSYRNRLEIILFFFKVETGNISFSLFRIETGHPGMPYYSFRGYLFSSQEKLIGADAFCRRLPATNHQIDPDQHNHPPNPLDRVERLT
jgi:hypothetical protein